MKKMQNSLCDKYSYLIEFTTISKGREKKTNKKPKPKQTKNWTKTKPKPNKSPHKKKKKNKVKQTGREYVTQQCSKYSQLELCYYN